MAASASCSCPVSQPHNDRHLAELTLRQLLLELAPPGGPCQLPPYQLPPSPVTAAPFFVNFWLCLCVCVALFRFVAFGFIMFASVAPF